MATGPVKFLKYTAGLTITVKKARRTDRTSFCKQNHLEPMNSTISSGDKPYQLLEHESIKQSGSFKIAEKLKDYMLLVKFNLSFMVVF
jgi:hypothetical protein